MTKSVGLHLLTTSKIHQALTAHRKVVYVRQGILEELFHEALPIAHRCPEFFIYGYEVARTAPRPALTPVHRRYIRHAENGSSWYTVRLHLNSRNIGAARVLHATVSLGEQRSDNSLNRISRITVL